jgi:capsular exopolysaccharide synthesis family protein
MSRIFDALQMSKSEGNGFDFSLAPPSAVEPPPVSRVDTGYRITKDIPEFPSLPIAVSASSRLVSLTDQASLGAEKFRFLGVRLRQKSQVRPLKKVLITSVSPEEGKSMVSANLAISLAQRRPQRVLLLDGDLRRPSLSIRFGLPVLSGLTEWLQGNDDEMTNVYHLEEAGLWFLPAGKPCADPLELMQADRLAQLMDQLTEWFDWVLIDSPPVIPLADTSVWMRSADGILMVAREGTTRKRLLQRGLQEIDQSKLVGVVLNSSSNGDHKNYYQRYGPPVAKPKA